VRSFAAFAFSVLIICNSGLHSSAAALDRADQVLSRVKRIIILKDGFAGFGAGDTGKNKSLLLSLLSRELSQRGYTIASDLSGADAVLKGSCEVEVMLDDEGPRRRDIFKYKFQLVSGDERLWKTSLTIHTLEGPENADRRASVLVAERLHKAVQSALQQAKVR
jgi:hypothetical protein